MCLISRIIYRGAMTNFFEKVMLNRKMNKIHHLKHKGNNCREQMIKKYACSMNCNKSE